MPTIKINSSGKIILKGGLPSCTCCDGGVYVEYNRYTYGPLTITTSYFEMTGSAGSGYTGTGPGGTFTLAWNVSQWELTDPVYGVSYLPTVPGTPEGYYVDYDTPPFPDYTATVSLTPLP